MVITVMSVATPMVSPRIVSEARSLCPRKALKHWARLSLTASMAVEKAFPVTLSNLANGEVRTCARYRGHPKSIRTARGQDYIVPVSGLRGFEAPTRPGRSLPDSPVLQYSVQN